ncbi:MAG: pantetheine-phosphate adenylyltransferase [Clostridia bacterium]|nr:pantetheine-phosphate adenylyltransferase [Clostridia bacterium]
MKLVFPGSFDPITEGHMEIIARAAAMAAQLYVVVEDNMQKKYCFTREQRIRMVKAAVAELGNVVVDTFDGLTVDYCRSVGADAIVRGLRNQTDYLYEKDIAAFNRELAGVETLFLLSAGAHAHISSSAVRELMKYNSDLTGYVPAAVRDIINENFDNA